VGGTARVGQRRLSTSWWSPRRAGQSCLGGCQSWRAVDLRLTIPGSGLPSGLTIAVAGRIESVVDVGVLVTEALVLARPDCGEELLLWRRVAHIGRGPGAEIRLPCDMCEMGVGALSAP
jgi:hypothetical protein